LVDSIGDVIEIPETQFEPVPDTLKGPIRKFTSGVYKTKDVIISIVDLDKLNLELNQLESN
jgi:purine-binding chemotaxis protein CheW